VGAAQAAAGRRTPIEAAAGGSGESRGGLPAVQRPFAWAPHRHASRRRTLAISVAASAGGVALLAAAALVLAALQPQVAVAVHEHDEDVLERIETKLLFESFDPNDDRPDRFIYGRSIYGIGPFDLVSSRDQHYSNILDSSIPFRLPTLRGPGPGFVARLTVKVLQVVDWATGVRRPYTVGREPVKLKSFIVSKYHHASQFCSERLMPLVEVAEMDGLRIDIPLPYGIGFGPNRPSATRFPHDWVVFIRLEDVRSAIGVQYPRRADKFMIEYQVYWTEDPQLQDAHVTLADALGCAEEDTRYSLELGPAHQHHFTDPTH